ncbi:hypothetical protein ACFL6C_12050 [Myxococcota bacterium]
MKVAEGLGIEALQCGAAQQATSVGNACGPFGSGHRGRRPLWQGPTELACDHLEQQWRRMTYLGQRLTGEGIDSGSVQG